MPPPPIKVAVFQSTLADASADALLAALDRALADPAAKECDLLVCPELFLGGYRAGLRTASIAEPVDGPFAKSVAELARRHAVAIAYGYPERSGGGCYNAAAVIGKDGTLIGHHRKSRLPNEFEMQSFATGDRLGLFELGGWRIGLVICYEAEFPETIRALALAGGQLVIVPTALSAEWTIVARAMIPTRAFENGLFIAYANHGGSDRGYSYLGQSCILGPAGQDLARAGAEAEVIGATLDAADIGRARRRIPYLRDRQGFDKELRRHGPP